MNVYVMTDNEGISGVYSWEQVREGGSRRDEGRQMMTDDINCVVEALKEAGVDHILVRDCHGRANTMIWKALSPLADGYIAGDTGVSRVAGLEAFDAVILLGYHAKAGTPGAFLDHTWSGTAIQNAWINGRCSGEVAIDAAIAGDYGKPVIMVSGDDKLCAEAKEILPWVKTACVKTGLAEGGGILLPREKAHRILRETVAQAVAAFAEAKPYIVEKPVRFRIERTERSVIPSEISKPYMRVIDNRTYEVTADTMLEALYRM
ncbi:MAG: M55 family metallopeptidase [Eubacteriales bacterium]|nr:M55 family metallopeptidase [Eubacteriales bacterium]